jgi:2-keto-3-deoxy-L-rhamnonate aldolase RhmA
VATANESTAVVVQIETAAAVTETEPIAAMDGIDSLFVGPTDLSFVRDGAEEYLAALEATTSRRTPSMDPRRRGTGRRHRD